MYVSLIYTQKKSKQILGLCVFLSKDALSNVYRWFISFELPANSTRGAMCLKEAYPTRIFSL